MTDFSDPTALAEQAAADLLGRLGVDRLDLAIVLGSGWSSAASGLGETLGSVPLGEIAGFSTPVVAGHGGEARAVRAASGKTALVLTGRTHYYEDRGVAPVVHGVRTAAAAGASRVVLTNGSGGLNPDWAPGTPVLISDHINLTGSSPLRGATFVDLTDAYSAELRALARTVDPSLAEGVYVQFPGPHYETPAEVRMAKTIGGHIVGMSTALEAIAARQAGMEILGFSLITNLAAGIQTTPLSHAEVIEAGQAAEPVISALLARVIGQL